MHKHQLSLNSRDAVTGIYIEEMIASFREQMQDTERLADELNDLLMNYEFTSGHGDIGVQLETLTRWAECYRYGLSSADRIFRNGDTLLKSLGHRLNLETRGLDHSADRKAHAQ